jgi:cysteinyl-tRNA synthetase
MGRKYLGDTFDIHGGGMDLMFPHHECEIAQSVAAQGHDAVKYWMHNNMITIEGKKMGKSYGNFITLEQFFNGSHPKLDQAYSPMVIRFFILQAHYRSTVDFSNDALRAAEKALQKMQEAYSRLQGLKAQESSSVEVPDFLSRCREALDDDLNTPIAIAHLFEAAKVINSAHDGIITLSAEDIEKLKTLFDEILIQVLGVRVGTQASGTDLTPYEGAVDLLMEIRANAKKNKDWATSDLIRDKLAALGFSVKDTKNGVEWSV